MRSGASEVIKYGAVCSAALFEQLERGDLEKLIARDPVTAGRLLLALFGRVAGRTVFLDVLAPNASGVALAKSHGFRVQRTLTRMYFGENTAPGRPGLIYSICGAEKG